jgi:cytochrome c-type biogenesis protein CcmH/NrfF
LRPRLQQWNLNRKLLIAFFLAIAALVAQDPTSYVTPDVTRVGAKLACRCGGCRNTVANCPMLHCSSADPMRRRIYGMKARGVADNDVVTAIVREEGIVALASPPAEGFALITWIVPPLVLLMGFFVYSRYVRRNRREAEPLSPVDQAVIERFRAQIDRELDDAPAHKDGADKPK